MTTVETFTGGNADEQCGYFPATSGFDGQIRFLSEEKFLPSNHMDDPNARIVRIALLILIAALATILGGYYLLQ